MFKTISLLFSKIVTKVLVFGCKLKLLIMTSVETAALETKVSWFRRLISFNLVTKLINP